MKIEDARVSLSLHEAKAIAARLEHTRVLMTELSREFEVLGSFFHGKFKLEGMDDEDRGIS